MNESKVVQSVNESRAFSTPSTPTQYPPLLLRWTSAVWTLVDVAPCRRRSQPAGVARWEKLRKLINYFKRLWIRSNTISLWMIMRKLGELHSDDFSLWTVVPRSLSSACLLYYFTMPLCCCLPWCSITFFLDKAPVIWPCTVCLRISNRTIIRGERKRWLLFVSAVFVVER